jgi:dTDP-glucose 4,6-dehydratase
MKRIAVTGGYGFVGSALIRLLLAETAHDVLNIDKLTYAANPASIPAAGKTPRYRFLEADIVNAAAVRKVFEDFQPHAVMHLAAESHVDRSIDGPQEFITTNVVGTFTLLQEALRYWRGLPRKDAEQFRFLHVSTDEVFGSLGPTGLFTEESPYRPSSPYSASKASSDHLVRAWRHTYGLPVLITNCSNNYGPYQFPEKLIPHMIIKCMFGESMPVYGDGLNVRDWLYVEDHARALLLVLEQGVLGETYNIGGKNERTNLHIVETICDHLDLMSPRDGQSRRALITFVRDRPGHDRRYGIDATKVEAALRWRALECFESGIEKTIAWYLRNRDWWYPILEHGYGAERIGVSSLAAGETATKN